MSGEIDFNVIAVDGGVAGVVCAYTLAEQGREVLLIERAAELGSKNLPGGAFYCHVIEKVSPSLVDVALVKRRITRNCVSFISASSFVSTDYWGQRLSGSVNVATVLCAKLDV